MSSSTEGAQKILSADKAAAIIIAGMEQNRYRVLVGKDAKMLDLLYRLNPAYAAGLIAKKMGALLPRNKDDSYSIMDTKNPCLPDVTIN